jgi:hypothetical protein
MVYFTKDTVAKASKRFRRCIVTVVEAGGEFFQ